MKRLRLAPFFGALSLATGCPDDATPIADESSSSEGESGNETTVSTTVTTTATTADSSSSETIDPSVDTTVADESSSSSSEGAPESSSDESSSTGDACGNGTIDDGEACDGTELGAATCETLGFDGGELSCAADCSALDDSACTMADCGNDSIEGRELCDGTDLGGASCITEAYDGGTLSCSPNCMAFNFTQCTDCGDEVIEGDEECDGDNFAGATCVSLGFGPGVLTCSNSCAIVTDACGVPGCGDDLINGDEICDGDQLDGATCQTEGFLGGELGCLDDCTALDLTNCNNDQPGCVEENLGSALGEPVATGSTEDEDEDLAQACASDGSVDRVFYWTAPADGTYNINTVGSSYDTSMSIYADCGSDPLVCVDDIQGADERDARIIRDMLAGESLIISVNGFNDATGDFVLNITVNAPGIGNCCAEHGVSGCDTELGCADTVCALDADCCNPTYNWQAGCALLAAANCASCIGICGNGVIDQDTEVCDLAALDGASCTTEAFDYGTIACADDCTLDTTDCGNFEGDCCADNGVDSPGCGDDSCNAIVCDEDPSCCTETWDADCATIASTACVVCNPDACGNNLIEGAEVCDGIDIAGETCESVADLSGELGCLDDCTDFDEVDCYDPLACIEEDIGSAVGNGVSTGTTAGEDNDITQSCGSNVTTDRMILWTAPADGNYRFDTVDSAIDTVLSLQDGDCTAVSLTCNDDLGFESNRDSRILQDIVAGQVVVISVGGYNGAAGVYVLNINEHLPDAGDCCVPHGNSACDSEVGCEATVCALEADCCALDAPWSQACVTLAEMNCASCM